MQIPQIARRVAPSKSISTRGTLRALAMAPKNVTTQQIRVESHPIVVTTNWKPSKLQRKLSPTFTSTIDEGVPLPCIFDITMCKIVSSNIVNAFTIVTIESKFCYKGTSTKEYYYCWRQEEWTTTTLKSPLTQTQQCTNQHLKQMK